MKEKLIYRYMNDDDLLRITNKIREMEKITAGEICVSIKQSRPLFRKNKSVKELAQEEFFRLGINKTRDFTGILIYLLLEDRQFYILADKGINEKVAPGTWDELRDVMQGNFRIGKFAEGIIYGVESVGNKLAQFFPLKPDDKNELSNRVIIM